MPTWTTKVDARADGAELSITNESHEVGEDLTNYILLTEVPLEDSPSSVTVTDPDAVITYTEVAGVPSVSGEFRVIYSDRFAGAIEFHADDAGNVVEVDYMGKGSALWARDINKLQTHKADLEEASSFAAVAAASVREDLNMMNGTLGAL